VSPTAGYRVSKLGREHQKLLVRAATFAPLWLLGVAGSTWQFVQAMQAETVSVANEQKANANAVQAQEKEQEAN
jgi:hypothetical protein